MNDDTTQTVDNEEKQSQPDAQDQQTPNPEDTGDKADNAQPDDKATSTPKWVQERIDELTFHRRQAERERDEARAALEKAKPAEEVVKEPQPLSEPKLSDFDNYNEYVAAMSDYRIQLTIEKLQKDAEEKQQRAAFEEKTSSFRKAAEVVRQEHPDFDEVAYNKNVPVSQAMGMAMLESPLGPQIAYYLGKHPDEATKISRLSPISAAVEIGRIEVRLKGVQPKNTSQAPAPIKTPDGSSASDEHSEDLDTAAKKSVADYAKARGTEIFKYRKSKRK
jgi:hypothetical protein